MQNDKSKPIQNIKEKKNQMHEEEINKKCKGATGFLHDGIPLTLESNHNNTTSFESNTRSRLELK